MTFSAVDIGSNAIRVIIVDDKTSGSSPDKHPIVLKKRFPLRLGTDFFQIGHIGTKKKINCPLSLKILKTTLKNIK